MIRKWVNHDSPTFDSWFDLIFDSIDSRIMIHLRIKIKPNQNE